MKYEFIIDLDQKSKLELRKKKMSCSLSHFLPIKIYSTFLAFLKFLCIYLVYCIEMYLISLTHDYSVYFAKTVPLGIHGGFRMVIENHSTCRRGYCELVNSIYL